MKDLKITKQNGTTPVGKALWAFTNKPEVYQGKETGFSVKILMSKKDTDTFVEMCDSMFETFKEDNPDLKFNARVLPFMPYTEDKDGNILIKFKSKHEYVYRGKTVKRTVPIFNAKNEVVPSDTVIWNNSDIRIAYVLYPYYVSERILGVKAQLEAVQIINLAEKSAGGDNKDFGFTATKGNFNDTPEVVEDNPFDESTEEDNGDF